MHTKNTLHVIQKNRKQEKPY